MIGEMINRLCWEDRYREGAKVSAPEPWVSEMMELLPRGLALDVAGGAARAERLAVWPAVADTQNLPLPLSHFDTIVNVNFLDRALVPRLIAALKPGGALLFDTFLIDQLATGHPRDPEFLLQHYELRDLLGAMELARYREGITVYPGGKSAWRASALAFRRND